MTSGRSLSRATGGRRVVAGLLVASSLAIGLAGCGSPTNEPATAADATTAGSVTTAASPVTTGSTNASTANAPTTPTAPTAPTTVDAPTTTAAGIPEVPEVLRFTAPLLGGGTFDGASMAGRPVAFWFWAPT